ncbi:hypothetical protein OK015_17240 [Mycobacterium sp. Aquia_216]|uniref:alpha/beta fold hydrolase n=1 Tax=Mycobacterium sp. Aquia_216 TaxID=2991729 RepID=UPI00227B5BE2|nr:hypothetical protein [Mycobacterium sp. Aquia_216]WAJ42989.1 hypothetical protein OK015_17240 [Mycobacterium sp. Aquia_216]
MIVALAALPTGLTKRVLAFVPSLVSRFDAELIVDAPRGLRAERQRKSQLAFAERVPHAVMVEIADAGHYPHQTAAAQLLPAMEKFLSSTRPFRYSESRWVQQLTGAAEHNRYAAANGELDAPRVSPLSV